MKRGPIRRSGLMSLLVMVVLTIAALVGVLAAGWGPKLGLDLQGGFAVRLQADGDVDDETLDQAIEVIRSRVDGLGVAEPEITRQGNDIEVSLPGVTDRERARELVGQTAELRFRPVLGMLPPLGEAEEAEEGAADSTTTTAPGDSTTTAPADGTTTTTADTTTSTTAPTEEPAEEEPAPTEPPTTLREEDDPEATVILEELDDEGEVVVRYQLGPAVATGRIVETASAELGQAGQWGVALVIRPGEGIDTFNQVASECFAGGPTCPTKQLAIVLDSEVVSAPTIEQPSFTRDQISISGSFGEGEAKDLALVLRYGSLPVALEVQSTNEVSATLGTDSLHAGVVAGLVGLALVSLFMVAYYRMLGVVAILSLAVSAGLMWAILAWMGEQRGLALTLAGITGIIVSIGVAVDSNVVFYEHLREEVWRGRSVRSAASASFNSAFGTIVTANMASFIGAALLYVLSVGSVRGFALFLAIGTVLDMLASYFVMRPAVFYLARHKVFADRPRLLGMSPEQGASA